MRTAPLFFVYHPFFFTSNAMSENAEADVEFDAATASAEAVKNVEKKKRALDKADDNVSTSKEWLECLRQKRDVANDELNRGTKKTEDKRKAAAVFTQKRVDIQEQVVAKVIESAVLARDAWNAEKRRANAKKVASARMSDNAVKTLVWLR